MQAYQDTAYVLLCFGAPLGLCQIHAIAPCRWEHTSQFGTDCQSHLTLLNHAPGDARLPWQFAKKAGEKLVLSAIFSRRDVWPIGAIRPKESQQRPVQPRSCENEFLVKK